MMLYWIDKTDLEIAGDIELLNKTVGRQFRESGAGSEIPYEVDVSLVKNEFFREFVKINQEEK